MRPPFLPQVFGVFGLLLLVSCSTDVDAGGDRLRSALRVVDVLGGTPDEGFRRALEPRAFSFPDDHGPHPSFRTEWWYFTGNLAGPRGEPFGFQLTFFRSALAPDGEDRVGASWRTNQVYLGHFAVTDGDAGEFFSFERFARSAVGLAGAGARPFRVWVEDWEVWGPVDSTLAGEEQPPGSRGSPLGIFPLSLRASEGGVELDLVLSPEKPMVLQGEEGLSQKGPEAGNASLYYSFTRLRASGILRFNGAPMEVRGTAWMDREWSTSALSEGQVGWDWFALQLEDGHDVMVYRLRRDDGNLDPHGEGIWVDPEGRTRRIPPEDVEMEVVEYWVSPLDGARYPGGWRMSIPSFDAAFRITPLVPDQEMELSFRYWEGAVRVEGTREGEAVEGKGYVELTGYASPKREEARGRRIGRTGDR